MSAAASGLLLFQGKTAWFAVDVDSSVKHLWFRAGGETETLEKADYVFSGRYEDEELQQSLAARRSKYPVAVFHPKYIEAVCSQKCTTSVSIGKFLLMPAALRTALGSQFPSFCCSVRRVLP
jgi:hypothetical protein